MVRCPGQDQRFWKQGDIFDVKCPECGHGVEFFKDEPKLKCRKYGHEVANPKIDLGCAEWCQYAEQCLGTSNANPVNIMRDRLIEEMKKVFGSDRKRIEHALSVLDYAEQIQAAEGGDTLIVKAAAILHDIGIAEAQRKHNSSAGKYQEIEGPAIAKEIMAKLELDESVIEHVCKIIANHHSDKDIDTLEFKVVWDADWMVNLAAEFDPVDKEKLQKIIDKNFKTNTGHQLAVETFINN